MMDFENICLSSKTIELSEHASYIDLTNRLCYYDDKNLNDVMLPYDGDEENATEISNTLLNMPLVAKYRKYNGKDDFSGHCLTIDSKGNAVFGTVPIGTHIKVWISEPEDVVTVSGEIKKLPCLYAIARVWKRNANVVSAIKRLFASDKGLNSSWEISTSGYTFLNGIKKLTNYEFIGNCVLGSSVTPAYNGTSKTIAIASDDIDPELLFSEAIQKDNLIDNNIIKEEVMDDIKDPIIAEEAVTTPSVEESASAVEPMENQVVESETEVTTSENEETPDEKTTETASLTEWDLHKAIRTACDAKVNTWCYIAYHFPVEKTVWCEYGGRESELDYKKFTYEVSDDVVTVSDPIDVKLTVSIAEINDKIAEYEEKLSTINAELDTKNEAIAKAGETIQNLKVQISELEPFKEQVEAAEKERIEAEIAEQKEKLKAKMLKGNLFSEEEIAQPNIAELIEARNESAINSLIADKFVASFDVVETSENNTNETNEPEVATASLETDDNEDDVRSFMRNILFKN